MTNKINAILEGADHDTPRSITYSPLNISSVSKNASVIIIGKTRLPMYGRLSNPNNPKSFEEVRITDYSKIKGIELEDKSSKNSHWLSWVFEMPRSLVTRDGRFYMNEIFLEPRWEYYFPLVPRIIKDSHNFFSNRINEEELTQIQRRAF